MIQARAIMLTELSRVLGRNRYVADQKFGALTAIACWSMNLLSAINDGAP